MHTAILRKIGGSVMVAVPPALLEMLDLDSGSPVTLAVEGGRLVIESKKRKKYSLQKLLSKCDGSAPVSDEDRGLDCQSGARQGTDLMKLGGIS